MTVSVVRAFFHSGGLKAGTPSEIASTPVRAAQPELKARRIRNRPSAPLAAASLAGRLVHGEALRRRCGRSRPPSMTNMPARKR